jgi:nitrite reductase/ring-hydroxylating ferredoxin subunit
VVPARALKLGRKEAMKEVVIGRVDDFPDPGRKVIEVDGVAVGVFRRNGTFTAWENVCPHMGGPVCRGKIIARVEERIAEDKTSLGFAFSEDRVNVACPWHGYEFDIATGRHQGNPRMRLLSVKVAVVDGDLIVTLPEGTRQRIVRSRSGPDRESRAP